MEDLNGVLILAGGKSERMNFPKAFLLFNGKTFLKKIAEEYYQAGIKNIYVVLNEDFCIGNWEKYIDQVKPIATIIKNPDPELGRFHSLKLGIKKMLNLEFCFIQNIDNPFVNKDVIKSLMESKKPHGYTSPEFKGRSGHPILISKKIMQHLDKLPDGDFNLKNILSDFPKHRVQINNDGILMNINTPDEYEKYVASPNLPKEEERKHTKQADGLVGSNSLLGRLDVMDKKQLRT